MVQNVEEKLIVGPTQQFLPQHLWLALEHEEAEHQLASATA